MIMKNVCAALLALTRMFRDDSGERDIAPPEVGQRWRCGYNGSGFLVVEIRIGDTGWMFITVRGERGDGRYSLPREYALGLANWRRHMRKERRTLLDRS